jgi:PAS domain S-box-containing protein
MADDGIDPEDIRKLRRELEEAQDTLRAIRQGEVDALVVEGLNGPQVFTLRTADHPYRMLVEQMQDGAVTLTTAGDVLYCNARFAELVGHPCEKIVGGPIDRFIVDADRPHLAAALRAGRARHEGHLLATDGRQVPVHLSVGTFVDDGVQSLCLVITDLSELTRTRAARADAEAASQAKDEFLAMLGHELRNPLGAISSAISVLDRIEPATGRAAQAREVIARQSEHLTRLIEDILVVSRGALGKIVLLRGEVDVAEAVRRCVDTLETVGKLEHHAVSVEAESVWVDGDAARIEQIVMNLLSNATKFTPNGGSIRVSVRREQDEAVVRVADDGAGIPPEFLPSVFDAFVQGDRSLDRAGGGLGVGLTLVRRLAELHGGRVEAASPGTGRGSLFTVRLPALRHPPLRDQRRAPATPRGGARRRILVIEDNADNREMTRMLLETLGHEVHEAADGASGVSLAVRLVPEVVLVDIGLPGLDGYEVARQIRAKLRGGVRLIAVSGYGQKEDRRRAFEAGFDDHLLKPVEAERLSSTLGGLPGGRG